MSSSTPGRVRARGIAAAALAVICVAALAIVAVQSPGYAGSSVKATTRDVWVTNGTQFLVGRINRQIDELDSAVALSSADFDVVQDGRQVFAVDGAAHQLRRIDPATVTLSEPLGLPDHAVVALGGGVLAIGDVTTGKVWVRPAGHPGTGDITGRVPAATIAPGLVLAVGSDGSVAATAPGRDRLTIIAGGGGDGGRRAVPLGRRLSRPSTADPTPVAIAMVGTRPVVLDRPAGVLVTAGRSLPLPRGSTGATLQQSGPATDDVLVSTRSALLRIPLAGGSIGTFQTGTGGTPVAPVWLNGCAHAAWAGGTPTYLAWCGGEPTLQPIPVTSQDRGRDDLVFRVNRSEIVLNDIVTGDTYLLDSTMAVVNNWSQVAPPRDDSAGHDNSGKENRSQQASLSRTNCRGPIAAPTAESDSFGVRAGKPAILPVMTNDATTDCSAVAIDAVSGWSDRTGSVAIVDGGRSLQVTVAADASGSLPPLTYRIADGAGRTSRATVQVGVVPDGQHPAPDRLRGSATMVGVGGTVTDNVLADWYSPAGDPLWLTAVSAHGQDLAVGFQPGGIITVHDTGTGGVGKRTVTFALTDGVSVKQGILSVQVVRAEDAAPLASPIVAATRAGAPITVRPLDFVLNPGTDPARLASVTADRVGGQVPAGLTVATDSEVGTVTVTAADAGDYVLHYQVAAGALTARGVLRVVAGAATPRDPVAVTDIGYLAPEGALRMDLTGNDVGGGRPLAVRELTVPAGSPLEVTVSDMHIAHISARRSLPRDGSWFSYIASQGSAQATGWVHVVPVQRPSDQGPVASAASMTVRAGDAGTLPIGSVAVDRDGAAMTVQSFDPLPAGQGYLFAAGDSIRYLAPTNPPAGSVSTVYTVTDTRGRSDSAPLRITVLPRGTDHRPNTPPTAVARVFEGGTVSVRLPLDGIDPDGDWVTATGIVDSGTIGAATISGPDTITYTALSSPGVDTVTYTAADPGRSSATGRIEVVVVPPPQVARPPVAPDLKVTVAPGKSIGVDVLGSASDPAGLPITFATGASALRVPARSGLSARVRGGVLVVTAGSKPEVVPVGYTIESGNGLTASGVVTVTVSPDAQPVPPTASDVIATPSMLSADKDSVVVDVAGRVSNPGGVDGDLRVSVPRIDASAASRTGRLQVTVPLTDGRQVIAYRVSNAAALTASAFIVVQDRDALAPRTAPQRRQQPDPLLPSVSRMSVTAGTTVTRDIRDYVTGAPAGRSIGMPAGSTPSASTGQVRRVDAEHLRWSIPEDAPAKALLHVTVSDGRSSAKVAVPVTVKPATPPAPTFQSTEVDVAAGGSHQVRLSRLVTPGRPGMHLTFSGPTGAGHGITGKLAGSMLTVSADGTARKGATADLQIRVSDGIHPAVPATVRVTVVASTAPLAWVGDVTASGQQGVTQRIDVLARARNPLPRRGPLRLTGASVIAGDGHISYRQGGEVSITPGANQVGDLVVQVSVGDATRDPDRVVTATVTVTVVGRPGQVTGVAVVSTSDGTVNLKWQAPQANGSAIEYYLVRSTTGGYLHRCPGSVTRCRLTGLQNDVSYRFTVTAHNDVGDSAPSAASAPAKPDVAPEPPAAPVLQFGNRSITARWTVPVDRGSPITGYLVTISPPPSSGRSTVPVTGATRHTFTHLVNGTSYRVTVVARNSSGTNSDPSPPADMVPAAPPAAPAAPGLTYDPDRGAVGITWKPVAGHGDDAVTYRVSWKGDDGTHGAQVVRPGKPLSATISSATLGVTYTATVAASNKAGSSDPSRAGTVRAFTAIGAPTAVTAQATGADQTVSMRWTAPAYSGWKVSAYQYQIDGGGGWLALPVATSATIHDEALTNGVTHTVAIRACTEQAATACGKGAASGGVVPYGPPGAVTGLNASAGDGRYRLTWTAAGGNGRNIAGYQYSTDDGATWQDTGNGTDTSVTLDGSNGTAYTVSVRGYHGQDDGGAAGAASDAVTVVPYAPPGQVTGLQATSVGDSSFTLAWTAPSGNGRSIAGYQWTKDGGATWADTGSTATSKSFTATNGTTYTIAVRAYNAESSNTDGPASDPVTVTPYGPIGAPSVSASGGDKKVSFSWSPPADNGLAPYRYEINWGSATSATSTSITVACGQSASISVVAVDSQGHRGSAGSASGRADACPAPPASITLHSGPSVSTSTCWIRCHYILLDLKNFKGGTYTLKVYYDGESSPTSTYSNEHISSGDTSHWQFGSYAGDHSPGNYYKIRILMTGPATVDSGWQTFVNE